MIARKARTGYCMRRILLVALLLGVFGLLQSCAAPATHPSIKDSNLPKLVPVRQFVANADFEGNYRLSPDGRKMAFEGVSGLRSALLWQYVDGEQKKLVSKFRKNAPSPFWSSNSQHILYSFDVSGRENNHIYAFDTDNPDSPIRDLTPYDDTLAYVVRIPRSPSDLIYVSHNRRDKSEFDLYELNVRTGAEKLIYQNTGNTVVGMIDDSGRFRARVLQTETQRILQVKENDQWRDLVVAGLFDVIYPLELNEDDSGIYAISNLGRDKHSLVLIELSTGEEELLYSHPLVDVGYVTLSTQNRQPLMARITPDYPDFHFFDQNFKNKLTPFFSYGDNGLDVLSMDRDETMATLEVFDTTGASYVLANLVTGEQISLGETSVRRNKSVWVDKQPIALDASDGMRLHGYLSLPKVKSQENLPMVLLVHGGPWSRDFWNFGSLVQFLANRGYAVLQLNYRGSSGYGRDYMFAAEGEFAARQHEDLIDAIDWAIEQGIADPTKVGIMGASFGGYATLVGMTMTADRFACGVDIVGVSDLATLLEDAPVYWKHSMPWWYRFAGDPNDPADRQKLAEKSPINHVEKVKNPLLIIQGANDVRVQRDQSDNMVAALRAAGKDVTYELIKGEGHSFRHWKNRMKTYRLVEDFFHDCLGGRTAGLDFYQLGSWAF